jgi:hypothetical protein
MGDRTATSPSLKDADFDFVNGSPDSSRRRRLGRAIDRDHAGFRRSVQLAHARAETLLPGEGQRLGHARAGGHAQVQRGQILGVVEQHPVNEWRADQDIGLLHRNQPRAGCGREVPHQNEARAVEQRQHQAIMKSARVMERNDTQEAPARTDGESLGDIAGSSQQVAMAPRNDARRTCRAGRRQVERRAVPVDGGRPR